MTTCISMQDKSRFSNLSNRFSSVKDLWGSNRDLIFMNSSLKKRFINSGFRLYYLHYISKGFTNIYHKIHSLGNETKCFWFSKKNWLIRVIQLGIRLHWLCCTLLIHQKEELAYMHRLWIWQHWTQFVFASSLQRRLNKKTFLPLFPGTHTFFYLNHIQFKLQTLIHN